MQRWRSGRRGRRIERWAASRWRRRLGASAVLVLLAGLATACGSGVIVPGAPAPTTVAIPEGSQVGTGTVPVSCQVPVLGTMTFVAQGTGAVGTVVGPGQQVYLTDVRGALEVPGFFFTLASVVGATSVDASVTTLDIDASGATSAVLNAAATPIEVTDIPVHAGQAETVHAPDSGTLTIGPFTAPSSGSMALSIGAVSVTVTLLNDQGQPTFVPLTVTCAAPNPPIVLVGFHVDPNAPSSPPVEVSDVDAPAFTVPVGDVEGSLHVPLACTVGDLGGVQLDGTITGQLPGILPTGLPYTIDAASGSLDLPSTVVGQLLAEQPDATQVAGAITTLDIDATNSSPSVLNVAATPIDVLAQPVRSGQGLSVPIPASGTMTVGPFTAGSVGATTLTWGASGGTLTLLSASGAALASEPVSCQAPAGPVVILDEPVTPGPVPTVTTVSPASGPVAGGTSITITGTGFTDVQAVNVGNGQATYSVVSSTEITATVPPGAGPGPVDVSVVGPEGASVHTSGDVFTYTG